MPEYNRSLHQSCSSQCKDLPIEHFVIPFLDCGVVKELLISTLKLLSSKFSMVMIFMIFLGSSKVLSSTVVGLSKMSLKFLAYPKSFGLVVWPLSNGLSTSIQLLDLMAKQKVKQRVLGGYVCTLDL